MSKFILDPWGRVKTRNGYAADEVISSLQKLIRRGKEEEACEFGYELYITSPHAEEKMWKRLIAISVEDIGMGDPNAAILVNNLHEMSQKFPYGDGDRPLFMFHAIRYMCAAEKDRSSDLLKNIVSKNFAMGNLPEVPEFAIDKHTVRGQELGKESMHFLEEASFVTPQKKVDNNYQARYKEILEKYDPEDVVESTFKSNTWII